MEKIKKKIRFLDWPKFTKKDVVSVKKILLSGKVNYWTGNKGREFENLFKKKFNLKYTIAVSNASIGLNLALGCLNLKKSNEVLVTPRSFVASASCVLTTKAKPVFCDINPKTQGISFDDIKKKTTKNTKVIICVHLAGIPCEIEKITKFANKRKIIVIEDCSQSHGSKINNKHLGSFGDISVWSFCNDKIISTGGEGGMLSAKNYEHYKRLFSMKDHGKNFTQNTSKSKLYFKYIHDNIGSNYRMTEVQAQLGINQLQRLNITAAKRFKILKVLNQKVKKSRLLYQMDIPKKCLISAYRVYLFAKNKKVRDFIIRKINSYQIECNQGSCPEIYKEKIFKKYKIKSCKNALEMGERSISLPSHHLIDNNELDLMVKTLNKVILIAENKFVNE